MFGIWRVKTKSIDIGTIEITPSDIAHRDEGARLYTLMPWSQNSCNLGKARVSARTKGRSANEIWGGRTD